MDHDIQIEETSGYEAYQLQLELQQWALDEARKLHNEYNAIMANAWPGNEHTAWKALDDHCTDFGIDPTTLSFFNEPDLPSDPAPKVEFDDVPF